MEFFLDYVMCFLVLFFSLPCLLLLQLVVSPIFKIAFQEMAETGVNMVHCRQKEITTNVLSKNVSLPLAVLLSEEKLLLLNSSCVIVEWQAFSVYYYTSDLNNLKKPDKVKKRSKEIQGSS